MRKEIRYTIVQHLRNPKQIFAHTCEGKDKETLQQHMDTVWRFFEELLRVKGLEKVLERLIDSIKVEGSELSKEAKELLWELFANAIYLHDLGKVNPAFQVQKMKSLKKLGKEAEKISNADHSALSALLYMDIYFGKLNAMPCEEEQFLTCGVMYIFAYIISRHHSHLKDMEEFESSLEEWKERICKAPGYLMDWQGQDIHALDLEFIADCRKYCGNTFEFYILTRLLFALLTACDFYATYFYMNGDSPKFGIIDDVLLNELLECYRQKGIYQGIQAYAKNRNYFSRTPINAVRSDIFLEAEKNLHTNLDSNIFYLEAPTGSGKTNVSINLALELVRNCKGINKIFYVFPFNTLVDQTKDTFTNLFGETVQAAVLNSITPVITPEELKQCDDAMEKASLYEKYYLDRLFVHYPVVITTHVNFFNYLFGTGRETSFPLVHLCNSVVILDEIQSYRNDIWMEIISFLDKYAKLLNFKLIIMSATLPKLDKLLRKRDSVFTELLKDAKGYYSNSVFKDRVKLNFELLKYKPITMDELEQHVCEKIDQREKARVLIEFITKRSAREFFKRMQMRYRDRKMVVELTGDDSKLERKYLLKQINEKDENNAFMLTDVMVIATQVIEAGVDLDMDMGFKDISLLDNEEQFLGRINRSCTKPTGSCVVHFFDLDSEKSVYKKDLRKEKNLHEERYRQYLQEKDFDGFYQRCLELITDFKSRNNTSSIGNLYSLLENFEFSGIHKYMELIQEENYQIYLARKVIDRETGKEIDGQRVWDELRSVLADKSIPYAMRMVRLSQLHEQGAYFTYNVKKRPQKYDDQLGNLYLIRQGEAYIEDGKFDREKYREDAEGDFW